MIPTGINHTYHTNHGKWYKDKKVKDWEEECLWILKKDRSKVIVDFFIVSMWFYFNNKRKNDIDGRIKACLDLLERAKFIENDSQVTDLIIRKRFDKENSRIEIEL